jgi:hypothetical protein
VLPGGAARMRALRARRLAHRGEVSGWLGTDLCCGAHGDIRWTVSQDVRLPGTSRGTPFHRLSLRFAVVLEFH